jgi:hypothetical protein
MPFQLGATRGGVWPLAMTRGCAPLAAPRFTETVMLVMGDKLVVVVELVLVFWYYRHIRKELFPAGRLLAPSLLL